MSMSMKCKLTSESVKGWGERGNIDAYDQPANSRAD